MLRSEIQLPAPASYPWHEGLWQRLLQQPQRLPHALLLQGKRGLGKKVFAARLVQSLLCSNTDSSHKACGVCHSCQLYAAGTHPDLLTLTPTETGKVITVDQVRSLGQFLYLRPHIAEYKLTVIHPAEAMNLNASNSLLKLLEEPPLGSVLILVSDQPRQLPITIRSRCSKLDFTAPPQQQGMDWLRMQADVPVEATALLHQAAYAPLLALELAQQGFAEQRLQLLADLEALAERRTTALECAARWKNYGSALCLLWFQGLVADLIKLTMLSEQEIALNNSDQRQNLQVLAQRLQLNQAFTYLDVISQARKLLSGPLDELLLLEDLLIRWTKLSRD